MASDNFGPGVEYSFALYSCSSEGLELLQQWHGFMRELSESAAGAPEIIHAAIVLKNTFILSRV